MDCCNVCCESFDKKRKPISCGFCDFKTCGMCATRFILEGTIDPKCMNCKKPWSRKFLTDSFGKTFMTKKYKEKREKDLFETEKALMPATQEYAVRKRELEAVNKEIYELQKRLRLLKEHKKVLETNGVVFSRSDKKKELSIKCPLGECRGFVDSDTMQCGVCSGTLCKKCHEPVDTDKPGGSDTPPHECNPDTIETVKLLKRDTKNCPNCKTAIHKIEGCDQMYCTQCHTAFSWRTGEVVIGERIHNPHYYEYMRTRGLDPRDAPVPGGRGGVAPIPREAGDMPCGGIPGDHDMRIYRKEHSIMMRLRLLVHVERVEFGHYATDRVSNNLDLRVKYINGDITEEQFKQSIQRRAKDAEKRREILAVLNTLVIAGSDIMRNLLETTDIKTCVENFDALCEFVNTSMRDISKLYNCVVPKVHNSTHIITLKD